MYCIKFTESHTQINNESLKGYKNIVMIIRLRESKTFISEIILFYFKTIKLFMTKI